MSVLEFEELEQVYETLAQGIDAAGPAHELLYLSKLSVLLAHRLGDLAAFRECCAIAAGEVQAP